MTEVSTEIEATAKPRSQAKKRQSSRLKRGVKYSLWLLLIVLLLVVGLGYYLLNTTAGLKRAINLVNTYSGYQVQADNIQGQLLNKAHLEGLSVKGKHLDFYSKNVSLAWNAGSLFDKQVSIKAVTVKDAQVTVYPTKDKQPAQQNDFALKDIDLPVGIKLEDLLIENLTINNPVTKKANFHVERFQLGVDYAGQIGTIRTFTFSGQGIHLDLNGKIETKGDFPLQLTNTTAYSSDIYGKESLAVTVDGALKKAVNISIKGEGISDFYLDAVASSLFENPRFDANLALNHVNANAFGLTDTVATAEINVSGVFDEALNAKANGEIYYNSPQTNELQLSFNGKAQGNDMVIDDFALDLLTAKQQFRGKATYNIDSQVIDARLSSDKLQWKQDDKNPEIVAHHVDLTLLGTADDYRFQLSSDIHSKAIGRVPVRMQANGSKTALENFSAVVKINQQPIELNGRARWKPELAYQVNVVSAKIKPFKAFPGIKQLNINVGGDQTAYQANGVVSVYGDGVPDSEVNVTVKGTPQALNNADLLIKTLGGEAKIDAAGSLQPLDIVANIRSKNIQPQRFFSGVSANINSDIRIYAKQHADNLTVTTLIKQLSGKLQNYPLSGKGQVVYEQAKNHVKVDDLRLNLAGNRLTAAGTLALDKQRGVSNLTAKLNAVELKRLLPTLSGSVVADVTAKGNIAKPEITAKLSGKNLAYQTHRVAQFNADADVSLSRDTLNIKATAKTLQSGKNRFDNVGVTIQGKLSAHQIKATVVTPDKANIPSVTLAGQGGLDTNVPSWTGRLSALTVKQSLAGQWRLAKPAALSLSPTRINVGNLCLQQQGASLCANGQLKDKNGQFDIKINRLKTKQFAQFIPKSINVDTTINGNTTLFLRGGRLDATGKINAGGGQLRINSGKSNINSKIKQLNTAFTLKNNRLENILLGELSQIGQVDVQTVIPDINRPQLKARLKINSPSIAFIERLVPDISDAKGRIVGDMTFSGNPSKTLNATGNITLQKAQFNLPKFGTRVRNMTLDIFAKNGNQVGFSGSATAGKGKFNLSGSINPASRKGEITVKGNRFKVADSKKLQVVISPNIKVLFADSIRVRGEVLVPEALITPQSAGSKITASEDVVLPSQRKKNANKKPKKQAKNSPIDVEIKVKLGDKVRVASADIETRLRGGIKVMAKPGRAVAAAGEISVKKGAIRVYGQELDIQRGRVIFGNGPISNPALDIRATRDVSEYKVNVGVNVLGHVSKPEISLFSTPSMPDSSIMSYLILGKPPNSNSINSTAILQTGGLVGANTIARDMRSAVGLDVLDFSTTGMEAGKNLSRKVYVGMKNNFFDSVNEFLIKYKISGRTHFNASYGSDGEISADLVKEIETD